MSTNSSQGESFNGSKQQIEKILHYLQNEMKKKELNNTGQIIFQYIFFNLKSKLRLPTNMLPPLWKKQFTFF